MQLLDAIYTRQSIGTVRPDEVSRELIERLLDAAVQAPNHYRIRPWRFVVLTGNGRQRLGEVLAQSLLKRKPDAHPEHLDVERKRPLRAPLLIAVGIDKPDQPKVIEIENVCAGAAAVQNLLLAAHDLGLAAKWRTGGPAYDPDVKAFLGFEADQHIIAFIYIGYPPDEVKPVERPSYADRTVWMEA
jgi:nitroreductase